MTTATSRRQPELTRQTVVVIGGGAGIVLETAPPDWRRGGRRDVDRPQPRPPGAGRGRLAGTDRPCDGHGRRSCLRLGLGGLPCIS